MRQVPWLAVVALSPALAAPAFAQDPSSNVTRLDTA